jgi:hypothetical protein
VGGGDEVALETGRLQAVVDGGVRLQRGQGAHHHRGRGERQGSGELRIFRVAVLNRQALGRRQAQGLGVEVDAEDREVVGLQLAVDGTAEPPQPQQDHIHPQRTADAGPEFAEGGGALQQAQGFLEPAIEPLRAQDHVGGEGDGDHPHQGDQAHLPLTQLAQLQPQRRQDQGELRDLGHGEARHQARAPPVAHRPHDRHHNQRVAHQHKQRQHQCGPQLQAGGRHIQPRAEINEEEQQQEIAQAREPGGDRLPVGGGGDRHTPQEGAHLLAEAHHIGQGRKTHGPGHREQHQQFLVLGQPAQQRRHHPAHRGGGAQHEGAAHQQQPQRLAGDTAAFLQVEGGEQDHRQDHGDVLHHQKAHRNPAVQRIDLPLIGEQLHDDDRAGEGEAHGDVERRHRRIPQPEGDQKPEQGGEHDLAQARGQGHRPHRADQAHVELEPHHEQQHGDAHAGEQLQLAPPGHPVEGRRPYQDAGNDVADDQGLAQLQRHHADHGRQHQDGGQLVKHAAEGHRARRRLVGCTLEISPPQGPPATGIPLSPVAACQPRPFSAIPSPPRQLRACRGEGPLS